MNHRKSPNVNTVARAPMNTKNFTRRWVARESLF